MKKTLFILGLFTLSNSAYCQDTLRYMTYNLLQFGNNINNTFCPLSTCKLNQLRTIVQTVKPDVANFNEISLTNTNFRAQSILDSAFNINGETGYKKSDLYVGDALCNVLCYNSHKLTLKQQYSVIPNKRLIIWDLYYNTTTTDTLFLRVCGVHPKAGNTPSDATQRNVETTALMNKLATLPPVENTVVMGDLNVYTSNEACYQALISPMDTNLTFFDPINKPGSWSNNATFKSIHTQSTRTTSEADAGSTGGFDDRFDQILCFSSMLSGLKNVQYIPGTYTAVGQNGTCFNQSLLCNTAIPANLRTALYKMSDHLPVHADFAISGVTSRNAPITPKIQTIISGNPVTNTLSFVCAAKRPVFSICDVNGRLFSFAPEKQDGDRYLMDVSELKAGLYTLVIHAPETRPAFVKFIKN